MTILTVGMSGQQVADAVNNNDTQIRTLLSEKASASEFSAHKNDGSIHLVIDDSDTGSGTKVWSSNKVIAKLLTKAAFSHQHPYSDILNADGKFMPKAHTHDLSDINNITGLFTDISDASVELIVGCKTAQYSYLDIDIEITPSGSQVQPPFVFIDYVFTVGDSAHELIKSGRVQSLGWNIPKPVNSWKGWDSNGFCTGKLEISIQNPFSSSQITLPFIIADIKKHSYNEISLNDLVAQLKSNPSDPNSFISLLKSKLQEDLL